MPRSTNRRNGRRSRTAPSDELQTVTLAELLIDGSDRNFRELIALLYACVGRLQAMRRDLAEALGVGATELSVLMAVHHLSRFRRVRIRAVADHLHIAAPNVTASVALLQSGGWLEKKADPEDQRALSVELTVSGKAKLNDFAVRCAELNDTWFQGMSRAEMLAVIAFLQRLDSRYDAASSVAKAMKHRGAN